MFLPGESPWTGEPWGHKESDMTERLSTAQHIIYEIDANILKKNLGNQI